MPPTKNTGASWAATGFHPIAHEGAEWQCTAPNPNDPKKLPCGTKSPLTESACTKCAHTRCEKCAILR